MLGPSQHLYIQPDQSLQPETTLGRDRSTPWPEPTSQPQGHSINELPQELGLMFSMWRCWLQNPGEVSQMPQRNKLGSQDGLRPGSGLEGRDMVGSAQVTAQDWSWEW